MVPPEGKFRLVLPSTDSVKFSFAHTVTGIVPPLIFSPFGLGHAGAFIQLLLILIVIFGEQPLPSDTTTVTGPIKVLGILKIPDLLVAFRTPLSNSLYSTLYPPIISVLMLTVPAIKSAGQLIVVLLADIGRTLRIVTFRTT